ncbi:MAG: PAS domain S-box protein [Pseudomonadota bacterium]
MLARREGAQVVVLNQTRHRQGTALNLRRPLVEPACLPAALAVQGQETPPEGGTDYRGVVVLAVARPVPGTSWQLVAKVDREEVDASLRRMAWTTGLVMVFLLLSAAAGLGLFWRQRDNQWLRRQLAVDSERRELAQRFIQINEQANDIVLLFDQDWNILEANQRAVQTYGHSLAGLLGMSARDLRPPHGMVPFEEEARRSDDPGGAIYETLHQRADGTAFPVEVSIRAVELGGDKYRQAFIRDIGERKRAEQALAKSEAELSAIFQGAPIMMILVDQERRVVKANQAALEVAGRQANEVQGFSNGQLLACLHALDHPQGCGHGPACQDCLVRGAVLHTLASGQDIHRQEASLLLERPSGPLEVFVLLSTTLLRNDHKRLALVCLEDIGERKRAELALKHSEKRFRLLFEEAPLAYQSLDEQGTILEVNQAWLRTLGYRREDVIGKWFGGLLREEFVPHFQNNFPYFKYAGHIEGVEFEVLRADGQAVLVSFNGAIGTDQQGRFQQTHCIFLDITERRRAEQAIHDSEERFRATFEQAAVGMVHTDLEGRFLRANQRFCDFLGYTLQELRERTVASVTHPEDLSREMQRLAQLMSGELAVMARSKRYLKKDGGVVWGKVTGSALKDDQGRPLYLISVVEDITEQRKLEAQLRQSQKMEAMGTLAGGIAHDFNNILGAVLGYSEMALADARQGQVNPRDLEQVIQAALRAKNLVSQILTFGRKREAELRPLDLNKSVAQAQAILERTLPKMIQIETILATDLHLVNGDPNQLEQVLLNLATNARDAMPEGGRLLLETQNTTLTPEYCAQHPEMRPGPHALLLVSDSGQGMDQATREKVFDPFFTTKEVGRGTGLGLSLVYGIVKGHGGYIYCYSEPGLGTTFKVYLPAHLAQPLPAALLEATDEEGVGGGETILLVDDEEPLRLLGARMLEAVGYQVRTAASGEEALDIFARLEPRPDLVILDLGMPGMGGKRCQERLLRLAPELKVIIASGYSANGQVKQALEAGARAFVSKPLRRRELLSRVREVLDQGDA